MLGVFGATLPGVADGSGTGYRRPDPPAPSPTPPPALVRVGRRAGSGGFWRPVRIALGFLLLVLGVIGLFLPVLQGVLMLLGGLAILGRDLPWARSLTDRLTRALRRRQKRPRRR